MEHKDDCNPEVRKVAQTVEFLVRAQQSIYREQVQLPKKKQVQQVRAFLTRVFRSLHKGSLKQATQTLVAIANRNKGDFPRGWSLMCRNGEKIGADNLNMLFYEKPNHIRFGLSKRGNQYKMNMFFFREHKSFDQDMVFQMSPSSDEVFALVRSAAQSLYRVKEYDRLMGLVYDAKHLSIGSFKKPYRGPTDIHHFELVNGVRWVPSRPWSPWEKVVKQPKARGTKIQHMEAATNLPKAVIQHVIQPYAHEEPNGVKQKIKFVLEHLMSRQRWRFYFANGIVKVFWRHNPDLNMHEMNVLIHQKKKLNRILQISWRSLNDKAFYEQTLHRGTDRFRRVLRDVQTEEFHQLEHPCDPRSEMWTCDLCTQPRKQPWFGKKRFFCAAPCKSPGRKEQCCTRQVSSPQERCWQHQHLPPYGRCVVKR